MFFNTAPSHAHGSACLRTLHTALEGKKLNFARSECSGLSTCIVRLQELQWHHADSAILTHLLHMTVGVLHIPQKHSITALLDILLYSHISISKRNTYRIGAHLDTQLAVLCRCAFSILVHSTFIKSVLPILSTSTLHRARCKFHGR